MHVLPQPETMHIGEFVRPCPPYFVRWEHSAHNREKFSREEG